MKLHPYYFTIANKYRHEPHPASEKLGVRIHPDGWVTIMAETEGIARDIAKISLCGAWCFQSEKEPRKEYYPDGNLTTIV
jgi:hypothetical protein